MKKIRLLISEKGLEVLKAFAQENYLGNYIASNENDLYYKDILNFPDVLTSIKEGIVLYAKDNITDDDEYVWIETMSDMKRKNATYYSLILDTKTNSIQEYSNESGKMKLPFANLDTFEKIRNIENIVYEQVLENEMEM